MLNIRTFLRGLGILPKSGSSEADTAGELEVLESDNKLRYHNGTSSSPVVTEAHAATLTNKTLTSPVINTGVSGTAIDTDGTLAANSDTKLASQKATKTYVDNSAAAVQEDVDDLITLSGVAANSTNLGTFTGSTIPDNSTNKQAFQALETAGETTASNLSAHTGASTGVHGVVGSVVGTSDSQTLTNKTIDVDAQASVTNIANANIKAGANIAVNKLAALTASRAIVSDGSGVLTPATTTATEIGYVNGVTSAIQTQIDAKATGAASSTDEALARFDGTTGKVIQNSAATLTDAGVFSLTGQMNVDNLRFDGNTISNTGGTNITITPEASEYVQINGNFLTNSLNVNTPVQDSATTGANATVTPSAKNIVLTNASLTSIDMITSLPFGQEVTLINKTGAEITINNDTGATAAYRIMTGTGASVQLPNEGAFHFVFDGVSERWNLVGGTGSGGGQSLDTIFQLTGSDILQWSTGDNATFLGGGTLSGTFAADTTTPLQGLQSYLYTQAAGSLNDYLASPAQEVDVRFRGQECTLYFPYTYDGATSDIEVLFYDDLNAALIPTSVFLEGTSGAVKIFKTNVVIPETCDSIRIGFQVRVANSGKILEFDSVQMTSNTTVYAELFDSATLRTTGSGVGSGSNYRAPTVDTTNSTSNYTSYFSISDDATNGTQFTILRPCVLSATGTCTRTSATVTELEILKNGGQMARSRDRFSTGGTTAMSASAEFSVTTGDVISFGDGASDGSASSNIFTLCAKSTNSNIVTAPDTFSTDTATLTYAGSSSYTLSTLANAPVGTFITFTVASGGNTRTQTNAAAPTQTTSDMNTNGIRLFTRAHNATSTSGNPAVIAIQIGKGMKGVSCNLYKSTSKTTSGTFDSQILSNDVVEIGGRFRDYNESTGILILDAAYRNGSCTSASFLFTDVTSQTDGYVVINASKNPALTGLNINAVAARGVNTAGTSISNGGSYVTVVYDSTKTYDTRNNLNTTTGIFTASEAGYYVFDWNLIFTDAIYAAGNLISSKVQKNSSDYSFGTFNEIENAVNQQACTSGGGGAYLVAGDALTLQVFNNRTAGNTTLSTTTGHCHFTVHKTNVG